jgi:hypothetical protein
VLPGLQPRQHSNTPRNLTPQGTTTMKHHLFAATAATVCLLFLSGVANAQTTATGTGTANSSSNSGAVAVGGSGSAQAGGGSVTITNNGGGTSRIRQTGSLRTTPNAIAPGLGSAAIETCYGPGITAGVAVTGFGISGGAGQYDNECNLRLWARTLYAMGQRELVGAVLSQSPTINRAMGIVDQQRGAQVSYGRPARAYAGANGGCTRWRDHVVGLQCLD